MKQGLKSIVNEKFGDGIMSAIDFYLTVDKVCCRSLSDYAEETIAETCSGCLRGPSTFMKVLVAVVESPERELYGLDFSARHYGRVRRRLPCRHGVNIVIRCSICDGWSDTYWQQVSLPDHWCV